MEVVPMGSSCVFCIPLIVPRQTLKVRSSIRRLVMAIATRTRNWSSMPVSLISQAAFALTNRISESATYLVLGTFSEIRCKFHFCLKSFSISVNSCDWAMEPQISLINQWLSAWSSVLETISPVSKGLWLIG